MQDRVSLHPGRVKLVPVPSQENTYDMVRADSPTQEGTPLNKDSLLKDSTAALYGLGGDAVPDDVLALLYPIVDAVAKCGNCKIVYGSYTGTETYGSENPSTLAFASKPLFIVIRAVEGNFGTGADQKMILVYGSTWCKSVDTSSNSHNFVTWSGNSVSWYGYSAYGQMNESETVYRYVALLAADE